jgi:hypothetical protein
VAWATVTHCECGAYALPGVKAATPCTCARCAAPPGQAKECYVGRSCVGSFVRLPVVATLDLTN